LGKNSYLLDYQGTITGSPDLPLNIRTIALLANGKRLVITGDGFLANAGRNPQIEEWEGKHLKWNKIFVSENGRKLALQGENLVFIADENLKVMDKIKTHNRFPEIIFDKAGEKWAVLKGLRLWEIGLENVKNNFTARADKIIFEEQKNKWYKHYGRKLFLDSITDGKIPQLKSIPLSKNVAEVLLTNKKLLIKNFSGIWKIGNQKINLPVFYRHISEGKTKIAFTLSKRNIAIYDSNFIFQGNINTESDISEPPIFDQNSDNIFVSEKRFLSLFSTKILNFFSVFRLIESPDKRKIWVSKNKICDEAGEIKLPHEADSLVKISKNVLAIYADYFLYFYYLKEKKLKKMYFGGKLMRIEDEKIYVRSGKAIRVFNPYGKLLFEKEADNFHAEGNLIAFFNKQKVYFFNKNFNLIFEQNRLPKYYSFGKKTCILSTDGKKFTWYDEKGEAFAEFQTQAICFPDIAPDDSKVIFKKITSKSDVHTYFGIEAMYDKNGSRILLEREPLRPRLTNVGFCETGKYLITSNAARTEYWDEDAFRIYSVEGDKVILDEKRHLFLSKRGEFIRLKSLSGKLMSEFEVKNLIDIRYEHETGLLEFQTDRHFAYIHCDIAQISKWADDNIYRLSNEDIRKFVGD
jgi:hypothetical protein